MAKRKKTKKHNGLILFFKNERVHFIAGVLVAFFGIFMLLAIISFFFTGAGDQSKVLNKSFLELVTHNTHEIENWTGAGGAYIAETLVNGWFGVFSVLIPFLLVLIGLRWMKVSRFSFLKVLLLTAFGLFAGSITSAFILDKIFPDGYVKWGGMHGQHMERLLEKSIGIPGIILIILLFLLILIAIFRRSYIGKIQTTLVNGKEKFSLHREHGEEEAATDAPIPPREPEREKKASFLKKLFNRIKELLKRNKAPIEEDETDLSDAPENLTVQPHSVATKNDAENRETGAAQSISDGDFEVFVPGEDETSETFIASNETTEVPISAHSGWEELYDPRKELSHYKFPEVDLLKIYDTGEKVVDMEEQNENKNRIINTLHNYGIDITSIKATVGPTITLYEIVPAAGVRISRIRNLEDDIALSLSALGIRIIAPMPGKGTIGIEVPNKDPQIVSMHSMIASKKFQECRYELPVALGKTITNEVFMFDLTSMPHLLVAGATGQGKSVGLNAIITSLLYKKHPAEMKLVLVDPKMVEFNFYAAVENHFLAKIPEEQRAIITDVANVTRTLNSLTQEMDDRYELLMRAHVRTVREYNRKFIERRLNPEKGHRYMPYIVVIIDEFGDLIMTAGKEIEMPIARIAQKARAVGMHMVIATQRPTTNIITGTIKANFPARMAFRVTSQIDSRTILDMSGANQLIGRGDLLFSQGSRLTRVQGAFVDTPEVDGIVQFIGKQQGYDHAYPLPEVVTEEEQALGAVDLNDKDALFEEAARLIVVHQSGSTSLIQRKFSIGYNRAGRLMDQLEAAGIVGAIQGSKPREVLIQDEYSLEKLLDSLR